MLLTNWLKKLSTHIKQRPAFRSRERRTIRRRWQAAVNNQISTTEVLEDRTLLTTFGLQSELLPDPAVTPGSFDNTGNSVAVDGDWMVVGAVFDNNANGAGAGAVYLYSRNDTGTPGIEGDDTWDFHSTILSPVPVDPLDPTNRSGPYNNLFGSSVDIDGDSIIISARLARDGDTYGSAYIYTRTDPSVTPANLTDDVWVHTKSLSRPLSLTGAPGTDDEGFGTHVSISGSTAIVTARFDDIGGDASGSVYVFDTDDSWSTVTVSALTASDAVVGANFGTSATINGNTILVGTPLDDTLAGNSGAVYIFERNDQTLLGDISDDTWDETVKLTSTNNGQFGQSVAIDGNIAVIGSWLESGGGAAYVYDGSAGWATPTLLTRLTASDAMSGDQFGISSSIDGDYIVIGARQADNDLGAVYIYDGSGGWASATEQKISDPAAQANNLFASSVDISGESIVVGAAKTIYNYGGAIGAVDSGVAYAFGATLPSIVYVDDNFSNPITGQDPDGPGGATEFGFDAFATIQEAINNVADGGTIHIATGTYSGNVNATTTGANKQVSLVPGNTAAQVIINGDLSLDFGDSVEFQIAGNVAGTSYDQLVVNGVVSINDAFLKLSDFYTPLEGDQFLLIQNDGTDPISGTFFLDGTLTRLSEGYEFTDFLGVTGQSAFLTYQGGDGNDVAIVVEDSTPQISLPANGTADQYTLRLVGENVILSDDTTSEVLYNAPLSALGGPLVIDGEPGQDDTLTVDLTGIDQTTPLQVIFNGGTSGNDALNFTGGSLTTMGYHFDNASDGRIRLNASMTDFLTYTGLEPITSSVNATNVTLNYSGASETVTITDAGSGQTTINSTAGEVLTFINPTGALLLDSGAGNDIINIDSLAANYSAELRIVGGADDDTLNVNSALSLANDKLLLLTAESINLNGGSITTNGFVWQSFHGDVTLGADTVINNIGGDAVFFDFTVDGNFALDVSSGGNIIFYDDVTVASLVANAGGLVGQVAGSINTGSADIEITAGTDVGLTNVTTTGEVHITALTGAILDNSAAETSNINANSAALRAETNIAGFADATLDIDVNTLSAISALGDINISNTGALEIGTVDSLSGISAVNGEVIVTTASPLTVNQNVTGESVVLTATDGALSGDNLIINADVTSTVSDITLNAGDDFTLSAVASLSANTTVNINVDPSTGDPDLSGSSVDVLGGISATGTTITGGDDADTFNITPSVNSSINVLGGDPAVSPGDTLTYLTPAGQTTTLTPSGADGGTISVTGGYQAVSFDEIENLTMDANANLIVNGTSGDDVLTITATNSNSGSYQLNGGPTVNFSSITDFTFNGLNGNDRLVINNPAGGLFDPFNGITFNGGTGGETTGDTLEILGGTATTVEHRFVNDSDGSVFYDGEGTATITYIGLEPVIDTVVAVDRIFSYSDTAETITVSDAGPAGQTLIDSTLGESVSFVSPTGSFTINSGGGNDIIEVNSLDATFNANITIDGQADNDRVDLAGGLDLGSGNSTIYAESVRVNGAVTTTGNVDIDTLISVVFAADGSISAGAGNIDLSGRVISLGQVVTTGDVSVTATLGAITDVNGTDNNITAHRAAIRAAQRIGESLDHLNTQVDTIAVSTQANGLYIWNDGDLTIGTVDGLVGATATGTFLNMRAYGAITVDAPVFAGFTQLHTIDSAAAGEDLNVNANVTSTLGVVSFYVGDNVNVASGVTVDSANTLNFYLDNDNADVGVGSTAELNGTFRSDPTFDIRVFGDDDNDVLQIDSNGGTVADGGTLDGFETDLFVNLAGGNDTLMLDDSGDTTGDTIAITNTGTGQGYVNGAGLVDFQFIGMESIALATSSAADDITVSPNLTTAFNIVGGDPAVSPGDTLTYLTPAGQTTTLTPSGADGGTISVTGGYQAVSFDEIENLTMDANANLIVNGTAGNDVLTITATNSNSGTYQLNSGPIVNFSNITDFAFNGLDGDDRLVINNSAGGLFDPLNGITFNGGTGGETTGDTLEILGGTATTVEHRFVNDSDGSVFYDGEGTATITYIGLEPVIDTVVAADRIFSFLGGNETITLSDDGDVGDGESTIDSTLGESVTFTNPTNSLTINSNIGGDTVEIHGLDTTFDADLTVNAGSDDSITTTTVDIGSGDVDFDTGTVNVNDAFTTSGSVNIDAGTSILFAAGGSIHADTSRIDLTAGTDVALGQVSTTGEVTVTATTGAITNANAATNNITADRVAFRSNGVIGLHADHLELQVNTLAALAVGEISIYNTGDLNIDIVDGLSGITTDDFIILYNYGSTVINQDISARYMSLRHLDTLTAGRDTTINANITSTGSVLGHITIQAGDNLTVSSGATLNAATSMTLVIATSAVDLSGSVANLNGTLIADTKITVIGNGTNDTVIIDGNGGAINDGGTTDGIQTPLFSFVGHSFSDQDTLIIDNSGDLTGDTIHVTSTTSGSGSVTGLGASEFAFEFLENLTLFTGTGADDITVAPNMTTAINITGGNPITSPGDTLTYLTPAGQTSTLTAIGLDGGTIAATGGYQDVVYDEIESSTLVGSVAVDGTAGDDVLTITATNSNSGSYQLNSGPIVNFSNVTDFVFNGLEGDDQLIINNPVSGLFDPANGITFNGGTGGETTGDTLEILGGTATTVEHRFVNDSDGSVFYDSEGTATITYTGLEPVIDTVVAVDRLFSYSDAAETITVSDAGPAGQTLIDSTLGESVSFVSPTGSFTINSGGGNDIIEVNSFDATFNANITIDGQADNDRVDLAGGLDLGSGNSTIYAESVRVNGAVTTTGNVDIDTLISVVFSADGSISAGAGNIDLSGRVISLGQVVTTGDVSVTATLGAITDVNGTDNNITAHRAAIRAAQRIGESLDHINTQVDLIAVTSQNDNLYIWNDGDFTIGTVDGLVGATAASGIANIRAYGAITVNSAISALVSQLHTIDSASAGEDIHVNADITSTSGVVSFYVGDNINVASGVTVDSANTLSFYLDNDNADVGVGSTAELNGTFRSDPTFDIRVFGDADNDVLQIDSNGGTVADGGTLDGFETDLFVNLAGGNDTLILDDSGDTTGDTIAITNAGTGQGYVNGAGLVDFRFIGMESISLATSSAADDITVSPNLTTAFNIVGGDPAVSPGDTLTYLTPAGQTTTLTPSGADGGTISVTGGYQAVSFDEIENLTMDANANLIVNGTSGDDVLTITATNSNSGSYQLNGGPTVNFASITDFTFNGLNGNDRLVINNSAGGLFDPLNGITFNGGTGGETTGDTLEILGGTATTVEHRFVNDSDGSVFYDGEGTATITYIGLEPVIDTVVAVDRIFSFSGANETITVSDAGIAGRTLIDSTFGESVSFLNPTGSFIINAGGGNDIINIDSLDANFTAPLTINGEGDNDTINVNSAISFDTGNNIEFNAETIEVANGVTITATGIALNATTVELDGDLISSNVSGSATTVSVLGATGGADIQDAIDVAGNGATINISAGIYSPASTITVSQSVTIQGPQAGVDPRPGSGSTRDHTDATTEAIIDGGGALSRIFLIDADNVTLDGLVITNGTGDLIRSSNGVSQAVVQYNIIHNSSGDEGVQLAQTSNSSIQYNYIFDTAGDGANFAESSNGNISFNELNNIRSVNGAIYVYDSEAITIEGNLLDLDHLNLNDGIKVIDDIGADTTTTYIINNVVIDSLQDGINVDRSNVVISGNDISGSTSENGVIYVSGTADNVQITNNSIHDNLASVTAGQTNYAIRIGKAVTNLPTNVVIRDNSIVNNEALIFFQQDSQTNLDANRNWWGTADYTVIAAGIVGVVDGLGQTNGQIDFSTILTSGTDTDGTAPGFQPDTSDLIVHALGGEPSTGNRIQNAIDQVDDGGTIEIQPGTYIGDITVGRGITLSGTPDIQGTITVTDGATLAPGFSPGIILSNGLNILGETFELNNINLGSFTQLDVGPGEDLRYVESVQGENILFWRGSAGELRRATYTWNGTNLVLGAITSPTGLTSGDHASILNLGGGVLEGYFHPGGPSATGQFHAISNDGGQTWINETLITYPFSTPGIGSDSGTTGGGGIIEINGERRIYAQNNFGDIVLWTAATGNSGPLTNIGALIDGSTGDFQNQSPSGDAIGLSSGQTLYLYVDGEGSESTLGAIGALIVDASGLVITSQIDNFISVSDAALTSAGLTSLDEMTIGAVQIVSNTITGVLMINGDSVSNGTNEDLFYAPITISTNTIPPGSLDIEINGTTPGTEHDQVDVTGTVMIGAGATLNLSGSHIPIFGDSFTIINNDGVDPVVGEFSGLPDDSAFVFNGVTLVIDYNGGDGNDVVLVQSIASLPEVFVNDDFTGPNGTIIVDADPNTVGNQAATIGINAFATIQEGVDAVAIGGTVHITDQTGDAGTYAENVTITKDITLRGTSGVDGDVTITPPGGDGITVSAAATSATIENLTVTGTTGVGILLLGLTGDVFLTNVTSTFNDIGVVASNVNNFTDIDGTYQSNNNGGILVEDITNNVTLTRTLLEDNNADGDPQGEGFTALANLNFNSIGGDLLVEGVIARDSDGTGSAADQLAAFIVGGVGGNATFQDSTGVVQSVLVEGHAFDGIILLGVAGDTNLTNVTSINNGTDPFGLSGPGGAGVAIAFSGSITDTNGNYSGNTNDGFTVFDITGDVRLNRTTLEDNNADDFGPGAGFSGGNIDGNFIAEGVTIRDTDGAGTAASQTDGVVINGISGNITFQDSTGVVQSVTIEGHDEFGVYVEAFTDPASVVTFTNGTYSNNAEDGIHIDFVDGSATFTNVTVENNGGDGLQLFEIFGNVDINGGSFSSNHENGIEIEDTFDVTLTNVTSGSNLHAGIEVTFVDSFSDTDGTYQANEDAGIHLFDILGNVDLTRTILEDNNADDGDFGDGFTAVPDFESVAIGGDLTINGLTARSTNPGITHQTAGVYVEGVDGSVVIDGSTDAITISGNEEEGISLIDVNGDVTLTDVSLTGNTLNSFVGGALVLNIDTTTGNTVDHVEINTLALGGEDHLQHTRGGTVQDIIETANIGTLDIDFDAGDDTVTVVPHSTTIIDLNGGDPTALPGDGLTYVTPVGETATLTPAGSDGGTIASTGGFADVVFDEFESLTLDGPVVVNGTGNDDVLTITATSANSGSFQIVTDGTPGPVFNFSDLTQFTFNGLVGDDTLRIINPGGSLFDPIDGIIFNGGTGGEDGAGDTLEILDGTATTVEYRFVNNSDGSVLYDGEGTATISYTGLEPITSTITNDNVILTYSGANDFIEVFDAGGGQTNVDSTFGESVTFINPTTTFRINSGDGNDSIQVHSLGTGFAADIFIDGQADSDSVGLVTGLDLGSGNTTVEADIVNLLGPVTTTGNVIIDAENSIGSATFGSISAGSGNIDLTAGNNIFLGQLSTTGNVTVTAVTGLISDANTGANNITAGSVALRAFTGIGTGDEIETAVDTLAAASPDGNIEISNTGALEIGTVDGLVGVSAGAGSVNVSAASPLTVAANVTGALPVTLTAGDSAGAGDDLTVNAGVTVESTGANVVLNAGDDFLLSLGGEVIANTTIEINVDPSGGDPDPVGATVDLLGNVDATQTTINGGDDADIFNILPTAGSPITVNGGDPILPGPGDVLNLDFSGLANAPFLTLGATPGSGSFGFIAPDLEQTVDFTSIENVNSGGVPFHLVLDMAASGFEDAAADTIDVQLDAAGTNLLIDVNASNIFSGAAADILSFTVIGSNDDETLNINESPGGLPLFQAAAPAIPGSNGSHLNNAADTLLEDQFNPTTYDADDITIHYDGGDGTDAINVNFATAHNAAYFSDNIDSLGSGNIVAATPLGTDIDLGLSFGAVEGVGINGAGGGLRVDASSTPLTTTVNIDDDGVAGDGVSQITANGGFTNMVFSGFQGLQVVSGTGAELIDLIALDSATTLTQIELDADDVFAADDTANDTIRVRTTPPGTVTDINILAGLGDDLIQMFSNLDSVNNIHAAITVDGEGGNDTLTVIDSGDGTGDTFEVTSTTVDGLSGTPGSTDVTFANIDDLNVTGTGGNDTINVNLTTQEDLNNVTINGFGGDDDFFLQNSTPAGVDTRLNGDAGEDNFIFLASNVLNGFIDGGGDLDLLDYSGYTPVVHVALSGLGTIDGFQGRENNGSILGTGVASLGFDNIDDVEGTAGVDTLQGPDLNNYWGITGNDEGFLIADRPNLMNGRPTTAGDAIATPPEQRIDFTMFENLIGGNQQDRFDVSDGAGLTGTLDGALGNDSLDYRDFTTGVTVDLFAGTATNIGGGLVAGTGGGDDDNSIENVFGGDGNDNITGDNDNNILGDGFGNDNLDGGGNGVGSENGGNDVFLMEPGAGGSQDVITDIHGNDTIDFRFASQGIIFDVDIINTPQDVFGGNTIELRQIQPQQPDTNPSFMENIVGSEFNDIIFIDPLSQDGNFPIDGPPVLRSADGRGGIDVLDFDAKGQEVIDTGFSLTADGVGTVQYLNFENVRPFEDTPAFIVDDGDLGFSLGGDWPFHPGGTAAITNGIGFGDDVHSVREESPIGNGPAQAFWEFYGLTPGDYRISVTWPVSTNPTVIGQAATDAPYTIFDGARTDIGTAAVDLGTIDLNQQLEPDDFTADGTVWENLGVFTINSRTLTVMLTNLANGRITADAIRIERVSAGPEIELRDITDAPVPPTIIMDGHQGGINFGATELLTDAVRTFEITNQGSAPLNISNIVVPAGFTTNLVNQAIAPGNTIQFTLTMDSNTFGDRSGIFSFTTDDVDEETFNILLQGSVSNVIIIDDGDTDFSATAGFVSFPDAVNNGAGGFEGDVSGAVPNQPGSTPQPGAETATWTFTGLADGNYRVSTTWSTTPTATNRVDDAPFTLNGGGPIDVDQTVAPSSFVDANGVQWFDLDVSFSVIGGTLTVELTNDANSFPRDHFTLSNGVIADAVRIEYLPEPDIQVTVDGDVVEDDTGVVDFGSTLPGIPIIKTFTVTNLSADPVDVTGLIEFPPGFSIDPTSPFGTDTTPVTLNGGSSVTFTIQFDGGTTGSTFGQISFTTGDEDENPYNFTVMGEARPMTVEITDAEFSTVGSWTGHTPGVVGDPEFLYAGDFFQGGTGANAATWTFDVEPGRYQVVANWYVNPNITTNGVGAASNAPYTIFDNGATVTTVAVDQRTSSDDFLDDGILWEFIGDPVQITSNTLSVQLSDNADGIVYADQIRIYRVVDPVIVVEVGSGLDTQEVADGGAVDFEETIVGAPVIRTFTITNFGERNMALGPINIPAGFSMVAPPGNTNLPPGASTTFSLQMNAATSGSFSGMVSFGVDSTDANPFNFMVSGSASASMIVDNGDLDYTNTGDPWETRTAQVAYIDYFQDDQDLLIGGDLPGVNTATWQFTNLGAGTYQVASHWFQHSNLAPNAQITISGIVGGPITVSLDQRFAPNDFSADGTNWEELGNFQVAAGGTLTVTMSDDGATGHLAADAMRLELIPVGLTAPEIEVRAGATNLTSGASSVDLGTSNFGSSLFQTFTITNTGTATLNLGAITPPAGFVVSTALGTTALAAGQSTTFELEFNGATSTSGALTIANDDADENPFSFTVSATAVNSLIIDDGDAGFTSGGDYFASGAVAYRGFDSQKMNIGQTGTASWNFTGLVAGTYQVSATWDGHPLRDTGVDYDVTSSGVGGGAIAINQRIDPNDFNAEGSNWEILGTVTIGAGGSITVTLNDTAVDGSILADAIRIERTGPLQATSSVANSGAPVLTQADLNSVRDAALSYWTATGISAAELERLQSISFVLADLPDTMLGGATSTTIMIDINAAGHGWFVDDTPFDHSEFTEDANGGLTANEESDAFGRMDLLTVVLHEFGHTLGYADLDADEAGHDLMSESLGESLRRLPVIEEAADTSDVDDFFSSIVDGDNPLLN
ncbi:golvesin C-terminal-like domain-containing protein [Gimesia aquarii]|uniref:Uncharacterized protein n=1 Tax=Gimesia aquarii TaxID=2527964 RepID=A0A517VXT1_9PLAN|nr:choice-of-anchor D domain-containing protein [Gimesia aquarii]QDT97805.1 hypothetical protein V144x_32870 [Gimesia aquarii]